MLKLGLIVAVLVLVLDQASKYALINLMAARDFATIHLLPILDIVMVWNKGVSFGLFASNADATRWILIALSTAICIGLVIWLTRIATRWLSVAVGLILGGAIGNIIDRIVHGGVADFFYFHIGPYYWPAFNVADSAVVVGVGIILLDSLFGNRRSSKQGA